MTESITESFQNPSETNNGVQRRGAWIAFQCLATMYDDLLPVKVPALWDVVTRIKTTLVKGIISFTYGRPQNKILHITLFFNEIEIVKDSWISSPSSDFRIFNAEEVEKMG